MSDIYTEEMILDLREVILANFHPPRGNNSNWHIRPDEMARAVLDAAGPRIAARALREAADLVYEVWPGGTGHEGLGVTWAEDWLRARAEEIEANG